MHPLEGCPQCRYKYEREPGYFLLSTWALNYGVIGGLGVIAAFAIEWMYKPPTAVTIAIVAVAVIPLRTFFSSGYRKRCSLHWIISAIRQQKPGTILGPKDMTLLAPHLLSWLLVPALAALLAARLFRWRQRIVPVGSLMLWRRVAARVSTPALGRLRTRSFLFTSSRDLGPEWRRRRWQVCCGPARPRPNKQLFLLLDNGPLARARVNEKTLALETIRSVALKRVRDRRCKHASHRRALVTVAGRAEQFARIECNGLNHRSADPSAFWSAGRRGICFHECQSALARR